MKQLKKTVLLTGATDGLGKGIAEELARRGATLLLHGRDPARLEALAKQLSGATIVRTYRADLSSLAEVRALAHAVLAAEDRLDVLVNNAGIGTTVPTVDRAESKDGFELRFAVNYLSHYLLTRELLPLLEKSAPSRIVQVSSAGQQAIEFDDPQITRGYSGRRAYCQSKLAQITQAVAQSAALKAKGITINALHPATFMNTKIVPNPISTIEEGVTATMHLIADDDVANSTGQYFNGLRQTRAEAQAYDTDAQKKLLALSDQLVGAF